jgi:hypothetical protein
MNGLAPFSNLQIIIGYMQMIWYGKSYNPKINGIILYLRWENRSTGIQIINNVLLLIINIFGGGITGTKNMIFLEQNIEKLISNENKLKDNI